MNEILNKEKNFNVVLPTTNPHRLNDFNRKPGCYVFEPGLKKNSVTMGQYSVNTISWFLILFNSH